MRLSIDIGASDGGSAKFLLQHEDGQAVKFDRSADEARYQALRRRIRGQGPEEFLRLVLAEVQDVAGGAALSRLRTVIVGLPGPVRGGVLLAAPNLGPAWTGVDVRALVRRLVGDTSIEVLAYNDLILGLAWLVERHQPTAPVEMWMIGGGMGIARAEPVEDGWLLCASERAHLPLVLRDEVDGAALELEAFTSTTGMLAGYHERAGEVLPSFEALLARRDAAAARVVDRALAALGVCAAIASVEHVQRVFLVGPAVRSLRDHLSETDGSQLSGQVRTRARAWLDQGRPAGASVVPVADVAYEERLSDNTSGGEAGQRLRELAPGRYVLPRAATRTPPARPAAKA